MAELEDASALLGNGPGLRAFLHEHSYLYFRGLVDAERVLSVRRLILGELAALGWLADGSEPKDAMRGPRATGEGPAPSADFFEAYARVQSLQAFHELAHDEALLQVTTDVLGEEVLCHPRKIFRVSPAEDPRFVTPPHQDFRLIQGTVDVLTGWMPLGDCPDELGGLKVLEGSHHRLRTAHVVNATGSVACPVDDDDARWASTSFTTGDLLLFHSLTVHGAKPNLTDRLRLSVDFRYQPRSQPVVDGSLGAHYCPNIPDYAVLTKGWTSTRSVDVPEGLDIVGVSDPFADEMDYEPSRLTLATG